MANEDEDKIAKEIEEQVKIEEGIEQETFGKAKEQIAKQNDLDGYVENPGQCFGTDGMMEPTVERTNGVLINLIKILKVNYLQAQIDRKLLSQSQQEKNMMPYIIFAGEEITIKFVVPPTDRYGNWGKKYVTKEEAERWQNDSKNQ